MIVKLLDYVDFELTGINDFTLALFLVLVNKNFEPKIEKIFLPIHFNICFWCSKEPSH